MNGLRSVLLSVPYLLCCLPFLVPFLNVRNVRLLGVSSRLAAVVGGVEVVLPVVGGVCTLGGSVLGAEGPGYWNHRLAWCC